MTTLRDRLRAGETLYGGWSTLLGPAGLAALVAGLDYGVVDLQHGVAAETDLPALCAAVEATGAVPLARARSADGADLARALDLGAHGVVVPSLGSLEEARAAVAACRYPPAGRRSTGRVSGGAADPLVVLMVETPGLLDDVEELVRLDGLDAVYVGPWDLSLGLGCAPDPDDPVLAAALSRVLAACGAAGVPVGVHAQDAATAHRYREAGCRLVTVVVDRAVLTAGTAAALQTLRG